MDPYELEAFERQREAEERQRETERKEEEYQSRAETAGPSLPPAPLNAFNPGEIRADRNPAL